MKNLFLFTFVFLLHLTWALPVWAESFDFRDTLETVQEGVEEQSEDLEEGAEAIILPSFQEDESEEDGATGLVRALQQFLDFFKLIIAPIAILVIVIMGVRLISAGRDNEEVAGKAKNFIRYAMEGLIVIFAADALVAVIFGPEGEIFRGGSAGASEFGRQSSQFLEGIYTLVEIVIASIAVFVLVIAGMRYVAGSYSEDQIAKAKRQIIWALVGLFIIAIAEFVVKRILFPNQGETIGLADAKDLFAQVTNFVAGTMGTLAFAFMLYAGYLYVTAAGNEDNVAKAKKILIGAVIGLILAAGAFALTNTIVALDASR